jgi:hypothetical protein
MTACVIRHILASLVRHLLRYLHHLLPYSILRHLYQYSSFVSSGEQRQAVLVPVGTSPMKMGDSPVKPVTDMSSKPKSSPIPTRHFYPRLTSREIESVQTDTNTRDAHSKRRGNTPGAASHINITERLAYAPEDIGSTGDSSPPGRKVPTPTQLEELPAFCLGHHLTKLAMGRLSGHHSRSADFKLNAD